MNKSPAFQMYVNDWLSSPKIMLMTPAQEGAYLRLLLIAWNDPDCSIPDDDKQLAVLTRMGEEWLKGGSTLVRECFNQHPTKPGRLVNLRLLQEREKQRVWREKSQQGGIKSGQLRQEKALAARAKRAKGGSRVVEPKGNSSSSSSSSSSIKDMSSDIFNHWKTVHNHPKAILGAELRKKIADRIAEGFSPEDLKLAIEGCKASAWHQGDNDRKKKFDGLGLILRDADHVNNFISELGNGAANGNGSTSHQPPVVVAPPEYRQRKQNENSRTDI